MSADPFQEKFVLTVSWCTRQYAAESPTVLRALVPLGPFVRLQPVADAPEVGHLTAPSFLSLPWFCVFLFQSKPLMRLGEREFPHCGTCSADEGFL